MINLVLSPKGERELPQELQIVKTFCCPKSRLDAFTKWLESKNCQCKIGGFEDETHIQIAYTIDNLITQGERREILRAFGL